MPAPSVESFCERCGTKYTFEAPPQRGQRLKGLGRTLGLLPDSPELESVGLVASRDPFHGTFHFCLDCRQYTCPNCWNEAAGFCQGCVPLPESPDLGGAEAFAVLEAESALRDAAAEHRLMGRAEAWPDVDLPQPEVEPEPEPLIAFAPEVVPDYAAPEPEVELVYAAEPVEDATETINAQLMRALAELDLPEPEAVAEPEMVDVPLEPLAETETVAADAEMIAEPAVEAEPIAAAAAQSEAAQASAPAHEMPLAAAVTDGIVEPDGLMERAWDVLYTLPATVEFTEDDPSAGDWAVLAAEPVADAEPQMGAEPVSRARRCRRARDARPACRRTRHDLRA